MAILNSIKEIGFAGLLDIFLMALLVYTLLVWFKQTRAAFVLTGIVIVACAYILMRQFDMVMLATVFEKFFAVILIALVVIFQEELKHFFERIAMWSLRGNFRRVKETRLARQEVETLVRTLMDLGREKIGALIVIQGNDLIVRHMGGGTELDAKLSEPLLKSIFDPNSIGHDGAVIIQNDRVSQFQVHLPLSKNLRKLARSGTRHAAALGMSELTDTLCLVVSEEQGTISVSHRGNIEHISDPEKLAFILDNFYQKIHPLGEESFWKSFYRKNWREKSIALGLTVTLWFVLVQGFKFKYQTYSVPVTHSELKSPLIIKEMNPKKVNVTLRGPRNAFYFMSDRELKLFVRLKPEAGTQTIGITPTNLIFPKDVVLENIYPNEIVFHVSQIEQKMIPGKKDSLNQ